MKEIIYLDTEIINSMLAQIDQGLVSSFILESSSHEVQGEETQSTSGKSAGMNANVNMTPGALPGFGFRFGLNSGENGVESERFSTSILEGQKDILNKAFHDYSLDRLLINLNNSEMINSDTEHTEGKIYSIESNFRLFDFDLIKRAANTELLTDFFALSNNKTDITFEEAEIILKSKISTPTDKAKANQALGAKNIVRSSVHNYKKPEIFGLLGDNLLENLAILKFDDIIALANKDFLRISSTILALTNNTRKAKILFRVISKKTDIYSDENIHSIQSDHLRLLPTVMLDIILGGLKIIEKDDILVTPIAIYYEEN